MDVDDRQSHPLDEDHVLEPIDADAAVPMPLLGEDPIITDVRGRLWRVRRRSAMGLAGRLPALAADSRWPALAAAGLVLAVLIVLALLL
jgi:hypothetical protein